MVKTLDIGNLLEKWLKIEYPGKWVVIAYEPVYSSEGELDKLKEEYHRIIREEVDSNAYNTALQGLCDLNCFAFLCENEEEAWQIFKKFPDPEEIGYACLFGPSVYDPEGMILTTNT